MKLNGSKIILFTFTNIQGKDPVYTCVFPMLCKEMKELLKQLICALVYS